MYLVSFICSILFLGVLTSTFRLLTTLSEIELFSFNWLQHQAICNIAVSFSHLVVHCLYSCQPLWMMVVMAVSDVSQMVV